MPNLDLKTTNKAIKDYYSGLAEFDKHGVTHEMAVRSAFQRLLEHCSRKVGWTFVGEYKYHRKDRRPVSIDGGMVDAFTVPQGFWEAKDSQDDLAKEVQKKFSIGYPKRQHHFSEPRRAILWQGGREICDLDITKRRRAGLRRSGAVHIQGPDATVIGNKLLRISSLIFQTSQERSLNSSKSSARKTGVSSRHSIPLPTFAGPL